MKSQEKLIWNIFYLLIVFGVVHIIGSLIGIQLDVVSPPFKIALLTIPIVLIGIHSYTTLSPKRALFFLLFAALTGFTAEYVGLKYGQFFGTFYTYKPQLALLTVPVQVIFYWAAFIYTGYSITNVVFLKLKKPNYNLKNWPYLIGAILLDGWIVLAIDLFMDPIEVQLGMWSWVAGGPYFGVPIGNFVGWFVVTLISSGVFRCIEYYFPRKEKGYDKSIMLIPILCYGLIACTFIGMAAQLHMYEVGVVGSLVMAPITVLGLQRYKSLKLL